MQIYAFTVKMHTSTLIEVHFGLKQHATDANEFGEFIRICGFNRFAVELAFSIRVVEAEFLHEPRMPGL